jgi:hypothetical protein
MLTRCSALAVLAVTVVTSNPAAAQDRFSRMYDLRDLAAALPPDAGSSGQSGAALTLGVQPGGAPGEFHAVPVLSDIPLISHFFATPAGGDPLPETDRLAAAPAPQTDPALESATDRLVAKLCGVLMMSMEELVENVYFIDGEANAHEKLADAFAQVESLYENRVEIEVTCYVIEGGEAPALGASPPQGVQPAMSSKVVAARRSTALVRVTRSVTYVSRWTPIVGEGAVGLEPGTSSVTDGLVLAVRVSGGGDRPRVSVQGAVSKAEIETVPVPSERAMSGRDTTLSAAGANLTIGLPLIERRVIESDVTLAMDRATVVATVPGFGENRQIAIAVRIKTAP